MTVLLAGHYWAGQSELFLVRSLVIVIVVAEITHLR